MTAIFYSGTKNASSWAMRAWLALREQDVEFEERIVDLRAPQRDQQLARVGEFSPPAAVPVLLTEEVTIFDSLAIMEYASECGDRPLLPLDREQRARARSFLAWQHAGLSGLCPRLSFESAFYPDRRAMTGAEAEHCARLFDALEAQLATPSDGVYLCGELSLADLALTPTIIRLDAHDPNFDAWPLTRRWFEAVLARESVLEWLREAEDLPPVFLGDY
ncbi:MAG: glutathione S-transferase family protein [Pseudomonadota bacterium]